MYGDNSHGGDPVPDIERLLGITATSPMPSILADAIRQTRKVARREHIKADRQERVNLFITDLRRGLLALSNVHKRAKEFMVTSLCRKELWHDIGVPVGEPRNQYFVGGSRYFKIEQRKLHAWCQQAMSRVERSPEDAIQADLDELRSGMVVMNDLIRTVAEINSQAEPVVDGLLALSEEMS